MTTPESKSSPLLQPARPVGFTGYDAYVPRYRIPAKEIARVWAGDKVALPILEKVDSESIQANGKQYDQ